MQSLFDRLRHSPGLHLDITGLTGSAPALFLARAVRRLHRTICCLVPGDDHLEALARDLGFFSPEPVLLYPSFEIPPYTPLNPDPQTTGQRLSTLYRLQEDRQPVLLLASVEAIQRRILPAAELNRRCELVISGEEIDRDQLILDLGNNGYENVDLVRQVGDMAVRGGIIDLYPPGSDGETLPLRLDFFGDTVESIRLFDPVSQRSIREVEEAVILPAGDLLFPRPEERTEWLRWLEDDLAPRDWSRDEKRRLEQLFRAGVPFAGQAFYQPLFYGHRSAPATLYDYLPAETLLVTLEPPSCRQQRELIRERIAANHREAASSGQGVLEPDELFLTPREEEEHQGRLSRLDLCLLPDPDSDREKIEIRCGDHSLLTQEIELQRRRRGPLAPLIDRLVRWSRNRDTILIACSGSGQQEHMTRLLAGYDLAISPLNAPLLEKEVATGTVYLVDHPLSKGFDLVDEGMHLLSTLELFAGKRLQSGRRGGKKERTADPVHLDRLDAGDIVVHRDHGLARFQGLLNMELAGMRGDFLHLEFRDGDRLYVPVDRLHLISRYQGPGDTVPALDRLGSSRWQTTKKKVTEAVWQVAQELLVIYARREMEKGIRFSPPGELYHQLEESFPYEETEGQLKAIEDVLADMTSEKPMDRLVCGDVGYGKTEVAVRAAFKAIEDGYQVALLVPTTVLAEQHAATFRDRFQGFPVEVACLNRFRTPAQQRQIKDGLLAGSIDLVVGTHRLLSRDIAFHRLGLLIVDEEHRFGVSHKEKIKKLKNRVDVLTLTATPIPRTLQMSLLGIRDLSVISTPPRKRRSVKTFLARHEDLVIREAILRELHRGGQVFYVHNRISSIHRWAKHLASLVPQARIGIGHGRMDADQIEEVMVRFINHDLDVLLCTTIIESGLDIPNANTIIINRADHLGLADIYQLRGRVGRSSRQSYAYLLVPSLDQLTPEAKKRLRALMDASELGSGFKLAMNDLQIRGGGNLLGVSQSGHIAAVGYDLYLDLLQSTVQDLKQSAGRGITDLPDPEISLKVNGFLPEDYIRDTAQRYHAYRRLSLAGGQGPDALADLMDELTDRYGPLPKEAQVLCRIIGLRHPLQRLGIIRLEQAPAALVFTFSDRSPLDPQQLTALIDHWKSRKGKNDHQVRLTPDLRLLVPCAGESIFQEIDRVVEFLSNGLCPE